MRTSRPCHSAGRNGSGGAFRITAQTVSSSGASLAMRRNSGSNSSAFSSGCTINPDRTSGPSGWSLNSNEVTTPKLPPPPRSAQNRSGLSLSLARTRLPSAVTTSAEMRLSMVSPNLRVVQPNPPPSVRPATPVVELMPSGVASACACASLSKSASVAPGWTLAVRVLGSMRTDLISERSMSTPPLQTELPAMLWPPLRTASSRFSSRAVLTAWVTSAASRQRAASAGERSIMAFQIVRAASYPSSPGNTTGPRILPRSAAATPRRNDPGRCLGRTDRQVSHVPLLNA